MITSGKPVFGICRGFQEINVVLGGSLRRDVGFGSRAEAFSPEKASSLKSNRLDHHAPDDTAFDDLFEHTTPSIWPKAACCMASYGRDHLRVNSVHYQGVDPAR